MDIVIGVQTCNRLDFTKQCVNSILKWNPEAKDMLWVFSDDGSTDGTQEYIRGLPFVKGSNLSKKQQGITVALENLYKCVENIGGKVLLYIQNDWAQIRCINFKAIDKFFINNLNAGHVQTIKYKGENCTGRASGSAMEINNYTGKKIIQSDPIIVDTEKLLTGNWHYADIPGFTSLKFYKCMFTNIHNEGERLRELNAVGCGMYLLDNQPYTNLDYMGQIQTPGKLF